MKGMNPVLITMLFVGFSLSCASSETFDVPYIGKVKRLTDAEGRETKFFVPISEEGLAEEKIAKARALGRDEIEKYLKWLKEEPDPDVRRHYLLEMGKAYGEGARRMINELIPMLEKEPEAEVRMQYISCLSTLATSAGLSDNEVLRILDTIRTRIYDDPSWSVRVHAANVLSWYGGNEGIQVIEEAIEKELHLTPNALYSVPAALQRIGNAAARKILVKMKSHPDDYLRIDVVWRLYQLGLTSEDELLSIAESVAKESKDEKARVRAISLLGSMAKENPEIKPKIKSIIKDAAETERIEYVKRFLSEVLHDLEQD